MSTLESEKRKIIVNEIIHWRRSKLLPEQYCDFLLNLYNDTNQETGYGPAVLGASTSRSNSQWKKWMVGSVAAILTFFIIFHFNSFPYLMQISICAIFVLVSYILGYIQLNRNRSLAYLTFGIGAVALLGSGIYLLKLHELDRSSYVVGYLFFCSIVWMILGLTARMSLFHFCGWIGCMLVYAFLLYRYLDRFDWLTVEASWLPLSFIFAWLGWIIRHRHKQAGIVLMSLSLLVWFVPECFMLYATGYSETLQFFFVGKLLLASLILFGYRNKWTEWVT